VLLLGPLYHLTERDDRIQAWREAGRVAKPQAPIVAATISRFANFFVAFTDGYATDPDFQRILRRNLTDGQHRNVSADRTWFATAYFHHPAEIPTEVDDAGLVLDRMVAVETSLPLAEAALEAVLDDPAATTSLLDRIRDIEAEPDSARREQPPVDDRPQCLRTTDDHGTVSSPRRQAGRRSSTGHRPRGRLRPTGSIVVGCRTRRRSGRSPRVVECGEQRVNRLPGHVVVDQGFREPLRQRRVVQSGHAGGERQRHRSTGVQQHPRCQSAELVARALDYHAAGASADIIDDQAAATADSSYCRSTLNTRTTIGRSPATSNPPRRRSGRAAANGCASATRAGSISRPTTRTSVRTAPANRARSSIAVIGVAP